MDFISAIDDFAIIGIDLKGKILLFNPVVEQLLGFKSQDLIEKANILDLIPLHIRQTFRLENLSNQPKNIIFQSANGDFISMDLKTYPVYDDNSQLSAYTLILRKNNQINDNFPNLKALFDSVNQYIFVCNCDKRFIWANKKAQAISKLLVGRTLKADELVSDYITSIYQIDFDNIFDSCLQGHHHKFNRKITTILRKVMWFNITFSPVYNEAKKIIAVSISFSDITQKRLAKFQLQQNEANLKALFNSSLQHIFLLNKIGKIVWLNLQAEEITLKFFGRKAQIGDSIFDYTLPKIKRGLKKNLKLCLQGETILTEDKISLSDKTKIWLEAKYLPSYNNFNQIIGIAFVGLDITEKKKNESEILKAKQDAEELVNFKTEFLSTMSHELRTPLNAVVSISNLLRQINSPEKQQEYLNLLTFSSQNLLRLVDDILNFHKIEAGKISFEHIDFSLAELLSNIYQTYKIKADEKKIDWEVYLDPQLPELVVGDPVRIGQVFSNLITNAIKFTNKGYVRLDICLNTNTLGKLDNEIMIDCIVSDTGIGIPHNQLERIFDRYTQAESNTTRKFGGTGLGLAISKDLLEQMGSHLEVKSEMDKGSVFYFTLKLPLSQKVLSQNTQDIDNELFKNLERDLKKSQILLVEDNPVNQLLAREFFQKWGILNECVSEGKAAIDRLKTKRFDLVLMDLNIPGMNGYEVVRKIREMSDPYFQTIPIIAFTAELSENTEEKIKQAGMNDLLIKPYPPDVLMRKIAFYSRQFRQEYVQSSNRTLAEAILEGLESDDDLKLELNRLHIESLKEIQEVCLKAIETKNVDLIRKVVHKNKISFAILPSPVSDLASSLQKLQASMRDEIINDEVLMGFYQEILDFGNLIIEKLEKEILVIESSKA